jgi:hypothetical protein
MKPMTAEWVADAESAIDAQRRCRQFRIAARDALGLKT